MVLDDRQISFSNDFLVKCLSACPASSFSMVNCEITSLKGVPADWAPFYLNLSSNPFPAADLAHLAKLSVRPADQNLHFLVLKDCAIEKAEDLEPLASLQNLASIDLRGTPLEQKDPGYRKRVFELLPSLVKVDEEDWLGGKHGNYHSKDFKEPEEINEDSFEKHSSIFDEDEADQELLTTPPGEAQEEEPSNP